MRKNVRNEKKYKLHLVDEYYFLPFLFWSFIFSKKYRFNNTYYLV